MVDAKGTMPPAPTDASEQPTLRVMRLYKPRLDGRRVLPSCSVATAAASTKVPRGEGDFALSSALKLPDSFGNIYLGETFTAYISVLNHLPSTVLLNASLSAKLQSPSAPVDLEDRRMARGASVARPNPASALKPAENLDMIVEHQLVELGTHTLRVTVKFEVAGAPEGSKPRSMRKFYRFSVMDPISIASTCTAIRGSSPLVELQLTNTTQMDLLFDSCDFLPEDGVEARLIGGSAGTLSSISCCEASRGGEGEPRDRGGGGARDLEDASGQSLVGAGGGGGAGGGSRNFSAAQRNCWWRREGRELREGAEADERLGGDTTAVQRFDGRVLLCPEESYQLIYSVRATPPRGFDGAREAEGAGDGAFEEGSHALGQVELCWRTTTGESGSVRSAPVVFEAPDRPEVEVTINGLPGVLQLGRVAECVATVRNRSGRSMTLQLQFRTDGMVGVYVHGQSFRNLGELAPGTCVHCPLQLLALVAGLHELRGCTVADMHTAQEFPQGKLRDVLVEFPNDNEEEVVVAE